MYVTRGSYHARASSKFWYHEHFFYRYFEQKRMPWHKSSLSCQYFALNAILILDTAYTRRWNVTEIEKLSIKLKFSHNWKLVYCTRIYFTNIFSIFVILSLNEKCLNTNYVQEIDIMILRTLWKKNQDTAYTFICYWFCLHFLRSSLSLQWDQMNNTGEQKIIKR
jgi:hypothetical protein